MPTLPLRTLLSALCLLSACGAEEIDWTPALSMEFETIAKVIPSPDGEWVAYTRTRPVMEEKKSEMVTQIYVARSDGSRRFQLTAAEETSNAPAFSTDSKDVLFLSERGGSRDIWRIALNGGEASRVTEWEGTISAFRLSPDGRQLAFTGREKDVEAELAQDEKRDFQIVGERLKKDSLWVVSTVVDAARPAPKILLDEESHVVGFEWSPDSRKIAFEHWPSPEPDNWLKADISEVDLNSGHVRLLAGEAASERSPHYSLDGKLLAYVRSPDVRSWAGIGRLKLLSLGTGDHTTLSRTHDDFGRGSRLLGFTHDSKQLLFTETRGTRNVLMSMTLDGEQRELGYPLSGTLSNYGGGVTLNRAGTHVGCARESVTEAVEAYLLNLDNNEVVQVSDAHASLTTPSLGRTVVLRWKSKDGMEIEGLLTYPVDYVEGKKVPLALVIHGGPMGVFTETFIGARGLYPIAVFSANGYAVLRPNPRGSSGYGKSFRVANFGDWGGGDFDDMMAGVDEVIEMGIVDPTRMAIMGWSYGGFMTSWAIGQTERFQAACVGAAVTNLWSFTGTSDILDFLPDYFGGEPWEAFEAYRKHSPMSYVQNVTTPTLILHGEEDRRVPISQGYEFYNALSRRGVETRMVVYPRTPHGPREPKFMLDVAERHLAWVKSHLSAK